jgi:DNA replication protein DnaC
MTQENLTPQKKEALKKRIMSLGLMAPLENWEHYGSQTWLEKLIIAEEEARNRKNFSRKMALARLHDFKPMSEFDWKWAQKIDRTAIEELLSLEFMDEYDNIIFIGSNGTGKTMIAKNIAFEAVKQGLNVVFETAGAMLASLLRYENNGMLSRGLCKYTKPDLLLIDELGQISFGERHADLLFAVINARYMKKSTIITTNTHFGRWNELFPNATSVATIVDRLLHHSEVVEILGDSYRFKESQERRAAKKQRRSSKKNPDGG